MLRSLNQNIDDSDEVFTNTDLDLFVKLNLNSGTEAFDSINVPLRILNYLFKQVHDFFKAVIQILLVRMSFKDKSLQFIKERDEAELLLILAVLLTYNQIWEGISADPIFLKQSLENCYSCLEVVEFMVHKYWGKLWEIKREEVLCYSVKLREINIIGRWVLDVVVEDEEEGKVVISED